MTDAIVIEDGGERGIIESIVRGKPKAGRVHRQLPRRLPHQLNRQRVECRAISPAPPSKRNKEMIRHFITAALVTYDLPPQIAKQIIAERPFSRSQGHSRPGRASSKSGHVRYAAESGSKFRALAATP